MALPAGADGAMVSIEDEDKGNDEVEVESDEVDSESDEVEDDDNARGSKGRDSECCGLGLRLSPQPSMPADDAATCSLVAEPRVSW